VLEMNAEFFALAFVAALNPKLLALDLLVIENHRSRAMFSCILIGAVTAALTIGLVDVLAVKADAISSQKKPSAGVDLALGVLLLVAGALLATGRLPPARRRKQAQPGTGKEGKEAKRSWAARALAEPRLKLAALIGLLVGLPGGAYLDELRNLVTGKYSTATLILAVIVFVFIELLLIIIPSAFLEVRPERTKAALSGAQTWLTTHAMQLMTGIALCLGGYLTISGLIRLS
jgi:hypothetical protein